MVNARALLIAGMGLCLLFSACNGGSRKELWASREQRHKLLEMDLQKPTIFGKAHLMISQTRVVGTYVLKENDATIAEGRVIQDRRGLILVGRDGKKQRWSYMQSPRALKDEHGTTWRPSVGSFTFIHCKSGGVCEKEVTY